MKKSKSICPVCNSKHCILSMSDFLSKDKTPKNMKPGLDTSKIFKTISNDKFEIIDELIENRALFIELLEIVKTTLDNWGDSDCLLLNSNRMANYFKKHGL